MTQFVAARWSSLVWAVPLTLLLWGTDALAAIAQSRFYNPIPLTPGKPVSDKLSNQDMPTGQGGFARDYVMQLTAGSQLAIDLASDNFDSIVSLIAGDGSTIAENDDGPDGSTNSLLFIRITKTGTYYIRVRSFGEVAGGSFTLKVTLLKPL
ncbi:PPC domain-containing protein [Pantanalinema rosaneae CENA516]|uniref:PPC domain-containing protein n=1 Tax=Pantanalinema rosaneae TaxID=1620701 RepID=UPI003D6E5C93